MLARFKRKEDSFSNLVPAIRVVLTDNTFKTTAVFRGKDGFGRDLTKDAFRWVYENPNMPTIRVVTPLIPYELFERTNNPAECNLLAIQYYMGTDFQDVVEYLGGKMFVVDEKLIVSERIKNTLPEEYTIGRFNDTLQYTGWEHLHKKPELVKYEGDVNTRIELSDECKYKMYKLIGIKNPQV
jgi:hypothetical protein